MGMCVGVCICIRIGVVCGYMCVSMCNAIRTHNNGAHLRHGGQQAAQRRCAVDNCDIERGVKTCSPAGIMSEATCTFDNTYDNK